MTTGVQRVRHVRVLCTLSAPEGAMAEARGLVHVRLVISDVSLADEAAAPVAEADVVVPPGRISGPFELVADLEPGRHYAVTAHVDRSGDGLLAPGDLITTQRVQLPDELSAAIQVGVPLTELQ